MRYTNDNQYCSHCGGDISGHCCGVNVLYWCDKCGSNDNEMPPNIVLTAV